MKSMSVLLKNIRNLLPYFLLITIYFFFVNLEARRGINNNSIPKNDIIEENDKSRFDNESLRIKIPVIPYN